jgi:hypothetical protein
MAADSHLTPGSGSRAPGDRQARITGAAGRGRDARCFLVRKAVLLAAIGVALTTLASSGTLGTPSVRWMDMGGGSGGGHGSLSAPYTELRGLAAVSPTDIWAVGVSRGPSGEQARIQHWDGAGWTVSPVVARAVQGDVFNGVAATGPADVWAVGYTAGVNGLQEATRIDHWDGHGWTTVPSPNPTLTWNELDGVVALSPTDVWAVGYAKDDFSGAEALVEHWNGHSWNVVPVANPGSSWNQLASVAARGPHDIWAVGWQQDQGSRSSLTEHWDGTTWSVVPVDAGQELKAVTVSGGQVWATGARSVRWDGSHWQQDRMPTSVDGVEVWSASASALDDGWIVGSMVARGGERVLVEHWDGTVWRIVAAPAGIVLGRMTSVLSVSSHDVWIAGTRQELQPRTLIEHWDGERWSIVTAPD